jgi:hypothetical protein
MKKQLLVNAIQTPDGTILRSRGVHDFVGHTDKISGEYYFTDGGSLYSRRTINTVPAIELDLYTDDRHEDIREVWDWGSYGILGDQKLHRILLKDLGESHILAILTTQLLIPKFKTLLENELCFRTNTPLNLYEQVL